MKMHKQRELVIDDIQVSFSDDTETVEKFFNKLWPGMADWMKQAGERELSPVGSTIVMQDVPINHLGIGCLFVYFGKGHSDGKGWNLFAFEITSNEEYKSRVDKLKKFSMKLQGGTEVPFALNISHN